MESDLSSDDEVTTIGAGDSDVEQINSGGDWRLPIKETDVNIAKLVYVDNFPITKVANSAQLKTMFEKLNYDKVTYQSLNCYLEELYHRAVSKMKSILAQRSKADLMSITFDKWTAIGDNKFDWAKVSELINLLKPLKECTMDLQDSKANVKTAVSILKFLRQKSLSNDLLGKAIKTVWDKWIRPNQVADALLHGDGTFYDYIRRKKMPVVEDTEHSYGAELASSYKTFKDQCQNSSEFDIIDALDGFIPANVDAERLFSWGRLSKNYLQCQMSPDNHSRNVFLNKCQHLI